MKLLHPSRPKLSSTGQVDVTFRGQVGKGVKKNEMMTKVILKRCFRTLTLHCSLSNIPEFSDEIRCCGDPLDIWGA